MCMYDVRHAYVIFHSVLQTTGGMPDGWRWKRIENREI